MSRVFDWTKAAAILAERKPDEADAGIAEDYTWTATTIWTRDGIPEQTGGYFASRWGTPALFIDDEVIECWRPSDDAPEWDAHTYWPDEAVEVVQASV